MDYGFTDIVPCDNAYEETRLARGIDIGTTGVSIHTGKNVVVVGLKDENTYWCVDFETESQLMNILAEARIGF